MQVQNARRIVMAAAVAAAGSLCASQSASAQSLTAYPLGRPLNYGEIVTANSFDNSSYDGHMYIVNTATGGRTKLNDWNSWPTRPTAFYIEDRNNLVVATGTYHNSNDTELWRYNVNTGAITSLTNGNFLTQNGSRWTNRVNDMEYDRNTGTVYLGTGMKYNYTSHDGNRGKYWKMQDGVFQTTYMSQSQDWWRDAVTMELSNDGTRLYTSETWEGDSYNAGWSTVNTTTGSRTHWSDMGWTERVLAMAMDPNTGVLYGGVGSHYSSVNPRGRLVRFDNPNSTHSWTDLSTYFTGSTNYQITEMVVDGDFIFLSTGDHYDGGQEAEFWRYQISNGSMNQIYRNNNGSTDMFDWDETVVDMDVVRFTNADTGQNNIVIGSSNSNLSVGPNFYSNNSNGEISAATLLSSLATANSGVRPGYQNANNQDGDTTVTAAIDFSSLAVGDNRKLTLRARDDVRVNQTISGTVGSRLSVDMIANNDSNNGLTGAVEVNAAMDLQGGTLYAKGNSVSFAAPVTAGPITVLTTGATTVSSPLTGTNINITSSGLTTVSAAMTGTNININTNGLTTTAAITATGTLSLTNSGAWSLGAPINASALNLGSATIDLEGDLNVSNSLGTSGTINILAGGTLAVSTLESDTPQLNVDGGTLSLDSMGALVSGEAVSFSSGTISIAGDRTLTSNNPLHDRLMGSSVSNGQTFIVDGTLTLNTPYTVSGGTLSVGGLVNGYNLAFNGGMLEFSGGQLEVTDGAAFGDLLVLNSGKVIAVTGSASATIASDGYVSFTGSGRLSVDTTLENNGEMVFSSPISRLMGSGTFTNNGLMQGTGRIEIATVINSPQGTIRGGSGQAMRFLTSVTNNGRIELQGASFETTSLTNASGSVLTMSGGATLRLNPGVASTNSGSMLISGNTDIYGDLTNNSGGVMRVGGGGVASFFDDVVNSGNFEVAGGSAAVFFGTLDPGSIGGYGTIVIFGGLGSRIGQSSIESDVTLGDAATTTMLIGTATEYSTLSIGGEAQLAGTLVVTETGDRYLGAVYELITADSLVGEFANVILPAAGMGMNYELQYNGNSVVAVVVPEPATLSALAGLAALGLRRRR